MRRMPLKMFLFLIAMGSVVYWTRGAGDMSGQWKAAWITLAIFGVIVVYQLIRMVLSRGKSGDGQGPML